MRIIAGRGKLPDLHRPVGVSAGILVASVRAQRHVIALHLRVRCNDVQDTADALGVIFRARLGDDLDRLHRVGRQAAQHLFRIVAHERIRLTVHVHFEVRRAVHLDIIFGVDRHERHLAEHFERRVGFRIRVVLDAVRNLVDFRLHQRLLRHDLYPFEHFTIFRGIKRPQIGHLLLVGRRKRPGNCFLSNRCNINNVFVGRRKIGLELPVQIRSRQLDRLFRLAFQIHANRRIRLAFVRQGIKQHAFHSKCSRLLLRLGHASQEAKQDDTRPPAYMFHGLHRF